MDSIKEQLADMCHRQWSGWMHYLFEKCEKNPNGSVTMPKWAVDRWLKQSFTDYDDLSEEEKESDRHEADKFIRLLKRNNVDIKEEA